MSEIPKPDGELLITDHDKALVDSIFIALDDAKEHNRITRHVSMDDLGTVLNEDEINLVNRIYGINPAVYGFRGLYVGIEPIPTELQRIEAQPFFEHGQPSMTKPQDLPIPTFEAFTSMASAIKKEINRSLLITDGYRTSAKQALIFLAYLRMYEYDVPRTARRVAIPGYSEHCTPSSLALDLQNVDGLPSDENPTDFETTPEYDWLLKRASSFDFHLSYPRDNSQGMMFEPWHWRHIPS